MKSKARAWLLAVIAVLALVPALPAGATEKAVNKELIIGHLYVDHKIATSESAFDSNFASLAVVGVNEKEFGIYFYYRKNPKCQSESDFEKLLKSRGYASWSYSDNVIVIK